MKKAESVSRVVVIASGPPMAQKVLYCLDRLGIYADLLDVGGAPSMARYSRFRRKYVRYHPESSADKEGRFDRFLSRYITENRIHAVIAADIESSAMLHEAIDSLGDVVVYPLSSADILEMLDDKWKFQFFMESNGIPNARSVLIENEGDISRITDSGIIFPVILKPLHGESSHGVVTMDNVAQIAAYLRDGGKYAKLPLIAQQFAPGYDADLSVLAVNGKVVAHVLQSRRDPRALEFIENDVVLRIGRRIVEAANYSGVANIDVRIDDRTGSVTVLECNPRFWYTLSASLWRGLNFIEAGLCVARGESVPVETVTGGVYYRHRDLLVSVLWNPAYWSRIEKYNVRGLLQVLSDPGPFLRSKCS